MTSLDSADPAALCSGRIDWLDSDSVEQLSKHPIDSIETEFPHYVGAIEDLDAFERPSEQHPVFYGCFDWHSSVHSHWCLLRQLRLFDDHPRESAIRRRVDDRLVPENVEREVEYFDANESFEKPYGWGWFLRLVAELHLWEDDQADEWLDALKPLEERIVSLVETEFLTQPRPFRVGTHQNSAFALACVLDYARVVSDDDLEMATQTASMTFFSEDRNAPVEYEPLGWDFVSPALAEADLMRRVLDPDAFSAWLDGFLPDVSTAPYDSIFDPVDATSMAGDGIELHLVGLNLSKAWALAGLATTLDGDEHAERFERSAERHAVCGIEQAFTDDYAGAHWLTSFVLYLLTRNEGGIAPN